VAKAVAGQRSQDTIATKFGYEIDDAGQMTNVLNGRPEYVRKAIERSLRNLGTDYVDLYYLHRLDPATPIEDTVGAMSRLVEEGKVRYLGLSEVPADILRRAHAVHPISALESEYSPFDRRVEEEEIIAAARELGIGFVAYSPLGRGFCRAISSRRTTSRPVTRAASFRATRARISTKTWNWSKSSRRWPRPEA